MNQQTPSAEIHTLTVAEIARQMGEWNRRQTELRAEGAALYRARKGAPPAEVLSDHAKAVRERAAVLARSTMNGAAPSFVASSALSREAEIRVDLDAIDLILKALSEKDIAARAAAQIEWVEKNGPTWREECQAAAALALQLREREQKLQRMSEEAGPYVTGLPMTQFFGFGNSLFDPRFSVGVGPDFDALHHFVAAALEAGIIKSRDAKRRSP